MAMYSFLKVICKINKYSHILAYRKNEKLYTAMPGFKVSMGFGLHTGWAIEGSIGSYFKIDASYLSPNVNVSARLEAATHMYDCPLLFSGFFADELSPAARSFCRMVDVVSVKGSNVPLELWTFDISTYPGSSPAPFTTIQNGHKVPKAVDFATDTYYRDLQRAVHKSKFHGPSLNRRVDLHAIDATPAR